MANRAACAFHIIESARSQSRIQRGVSKSGDDHRTRRRCCRTYQYVSIRQHTSAYVSIRQHTSAYVSVSKSGDDHRTRRRCCNTWRSARGLLTSATASASYSSRERATKSSSPTVRRSEADTRAAIGSRCVGARIGSADHSASVPVEWAPYISVSRKTSASAAKRRRWSGFRVSVLEFKV